MKADKIRIYRNKIAVIFNLRLALHDPIYLTNSFALLREFQSDCNTPYQLPLSFHFKQEIWTIVFDSEELLIQIKYQKSELFFGSENSHRRNFSGLHIALPLEVI